MRIELTAQAWEAWVLPLYDARRRPAFYAILPKKCKCILLSLALIWAMLVINKKTS